MSEQNDTGHGNLFRRKKLFMEHNVIDSVNSSTVTLLVNLIVEGLSAVILFVGLIYAVRFLFFARGSFSPLQFKIILGLMIIFCFFWMWYIFGKISSGYIKLRENREFKKNNRDST